MPPEPNQGARPGLSPEPPAELPPGPEVATDPATLAPVAVPEERAQVLEAAPALPRVAPRTLLLATLLLGSTAIGGGMAGHVRALVRRRGWMDDAAFAEVYTLAQLMPGSNVTNLAAALGVQLGGRLNALLAVLGIVVPGALLMALLTWLYFRASGGGLPPRVLGALHGAAAAAVGVTFSAALPVLRVSLRLRGGVPLALLAFAGIALLRLDILLVLAAALPLGLLVHRPRRRAAGDAGGTRS